MTVNDYTKCLLMSGLEKDKNFKHLLVINERFLFCTCKYISFKPGFKTLQVLKNHADSFSISFPHP